MRDSRGDVDALGSFCALRADPATWGGLLGLDGEADVEGAGSGAELASELGVAFAAGTGDAEGAVGAWEEVGAGVLDTLSELGGTDAEAEVEGALRRATLGLKPDFRLLASIELILAACSMYLCVGDQRMHISLWRWEKGPEGLLRSARACKWRFGRRPDGDSQFFSGTSEGL